MVGQESASLQIDRSCQKANHSRQIDCFRLKLWYGKLIVYNPDERTSVRGDAGTATIYWTIPGQVFWSISSNISGPMVFSGSVSTTAGDYCPLNGISFDGYVSGLVDVQMMPGSNYATLEGSMLDIQGVSYVLPGVEAYMYH